MNINEDKKVLILLIISYFVVSLILILALTINLSASPHINGRPVDNIEFSEILEERKALIEENKDLKELLKKNNIKH